VSAQKRPCEPLNRYTPGDRVALASLREQSIPVIRRSGQIRERDVSYHHYRKESDVDPRGVIPEEVDTKGLSEHGPKRFYRRRDIGRRKDISEYVAQPSGQESHCREHEQTGRIELLAPDPVIDLTAEQSDKNCTADDTRNCHEQHCVRYTVVVYHIGKPPTEPQVGVRKERGDDRQADEPDASSVVPEEPRREGK